MPIVCSIARSSSARLAGGNRSEDVVGDGVDEGAADELDRVVDHGGTAGRAVKQIWPRHRLW